MGAAEERGWLVAARATGDRDAIESLVERFGTVVMGTCRRILGGDQAAASEAFRATFLVLLRRGRSVGRRADLGVWMHRAACRVARKSRGGRVAVASRGRRFDLEPLVDQAVDRLWTGRSAVIARDLMGLSRSQAADRLGCPVRTVDRRREAALRSIDAVCRRAARRALRSGRAAVAGFISLESLGDVEVPDECREAVVRDAARLAGDRNWDAQVSAEATELARTVLVSLVLARLRKVAAATIMLGILGAGASYAALHTAEAPASAPSRTPPLVEAARHAAAGGRFEVMQAGLVDSAREAHRVAADAFHCDRGSIDAVHRTSRFLLDAEMDGATAPSRRRYALAEHRARMSDLVREAGSGNDDTEEPPVVAEARSMLAEADLLEARGDDADRPAASTAAAGDEGEATPAVLDRLDRPVPMKFPRPTPLGEVLEHVRRADRGAPPLPVYVDPVGLKRAGADLDSPVTIAVEGLPLRQSLQLVLRQLGLTSHVEGGVIIITSAEAQAETTGGDGPSSLDKEKERARRGEMSLVEMKALAEKLRILREIEPVRL